MAKIENDEVNLLDVLASFMAALKKNLALTILLPIIGVLIALGVSYNSRDLFESSLLIETSLLTENECTFLFNQLDKVGIVPGLTEEEDREVSGFRFAISKNNDNDATKSELSQLGEKSLYLEVTARVYNQKVYPSLEKAIVKFINESPSVVRHRNDREKFYGAMIKKINTEIQAMEEIKKNVDITKQATYMNPSELYYRSVSLFKEKIQYEIRQEEIKAVHLIKGFDSLTIDAKKSKMMVALTGFAIGVAVLFLVLFIKFFARYFTVYETTH
jgi:hypothetical protein